MGEESADAVCDVVRSFADPIAAWPALMKVFAGKTPSPLWSQLPRGGGGRRRRGEGWLLEQVHDWRTARPAAARALPHGIYLGLDTLNMEGPEGFNVQIGVKDGVAPGDADWMFLLRLATGWARPRDRRAPDSSPRLRLARVAGDQALGASPTTTSRSATAASSWRRPGKRCSPRPPHSRRASTPCSSSGDSTTETFTTSSSGRTASCVGLPGAVTGQFSSDFGVGGSPLRSRKTVVISRSRAADSSSRIASVVPAARSTLRW